MQLIDDEDIMWDLLEVNHDRFCITQEVPYPFSHIIKGHYKDLTTFEYKSIFINNRYYGYKITGEKFGN